MKPTDIIPTHGQYFTTEKNSCTGLRIQLIVKTIHAVKYEFKKLQEDLKLVGLKSSREFVLGGICGCRFSIPPNQKIWYKVRGEADLFMPRKKTREGKLISLTLKSYPSLRYSDISTGICLAPFLLQAIECHENKEVYFLKTDALIWTIPPVDCVEITEELYNELCSSITI